MDVIIVLIACVVIALLIPARFDPAIKLKEWNEKNEQR